MPPLNISPIDTLIDAIENNATLGNIQSLSNKDVINMKGTSTPDTPLICAVLNRRKDVVKFLLAIDSIDFNKEGAAEKTALICAAEKGHLEMAMLSKDR